MVAYRIKSIEAAQTEPHNSIVAPVAQYFEDEKERNSWYYDGSGNSRLSIDIYSIWDEYRGEGIKVGVVDTQINYTHADLSRAYDQDLDFNFALGTDSPLINPRSLPYNHGTLVAGVIAAEGGNGIGSVGIANEATLVGLGIDYASQSVVAEILSALDAAVSLDVVNNSWSFVDAFADKFNRNAEYEPALLKLVTEGREGLGTITVFAAGNDGSRSSSNYHNFQNSPYTIAVGAVTPDGSAAEFSSRGANVLLSAAGVNVFTTAVDGGFNTASGTSFAAPAVSGAAALMLEANGELGYRDVQQILAYSARRDGLSDDSGFGDGWQYNGANTHNGGGLHFNDAFGYGMLNVHDAVRLAETWNVQSTISNLTTLSSTVQSDLVMQPGVSDHLSLTFDIDDSIALEHAQLSLNFRWADVNDLDVYLTSPDGTTVRLVYDLTQGGGNLDDLTNFTFDSVASLGEQSQGTWQVDLINRRDIDSYRKEAPSKTLKGATLTLLGSAENLADDTYIYTDEFGMLYSDAELASRTTLTDTDGGIDTLNAAAMTSHLTVDLSGITSSSLGGVTLQIQPGTIENAYTGDGNDMIFGSSADNVILAGRGNDTLYFSLGNDRLSGGQGSDTLFVNRALNTFSISVQEDGGLLIADGASAATLVTDIEDFVFGGSHYSFAEVRDHAGEEPTLPDEPDDGGTSEEEPSDPSDPSDPGEPSDPSDPSEPGEPEEPDTDEDDLTIFEGTKGSDKMTGTDGADRFDGGNGKDRFEGNAGDDELNGERGNDKLSGGAGADTVDGGVGNDKLFGNNGNDILYGGAGKDTLNGGSGNDILRGGSGGDNLTGGRGADTFVFDISDIGATDTITDFNAREGDRIEITGLLPSANVGYDYIEKGSQVYLAVSIDDAVYELARLRNVDLDSSELADSEVAFLFA